MNALDEQILRAYFRFSEAERLRLWMERLWHPEEMKWAKRGAPPPISETKLIRQDELAKMGFGEPQYWFWLAKENEAEEELGELAQKHCLWPHFQRIRGIGIFAEHGTPRPLTTGKYIARAGDIARCPTVSAYWFGLGEDILPNGTVPKRERGRKKLYEWETRLRTVPALPHVTKIGDQIRQQIVRSGRSLRDIYDKEKADYLTRKAEKPKMAGHKHGGRIALKTLDSCAWKVWREEYKLSAPDAYAFAILKHPDGHQIKIEDLYDE